MARKDNTPEKQHYVPQLLLREFAFVKKKQWYAHVFDKHSGKQFLSNVQNIAAERGFYEISREGMTRNFEEELSVLEKETAFAFKKLMSHRTLRAIDDEDKAWMGLFLASQHIRVKNFREMILDADQQFCERLRGMDVDPDNVEGFAPLKDEKKLREFTTCFLFKNVRRFAAEMLSKKWVLLQTTEYAPFWIGDNPVTLHNEQGFWLLRQHRSCGSWDSNSFANSEDSYASSLVFYIVRREAEGDAETTSHEAVWLPSLGCGHEGADCTSDRRLPKHRSGGRHEAGDAIMLNDDNVLFLNSLQARWADRYVMSPVKDFSMVERMLKDFPESRRGPRIRVG